MVSILVTGANRGIGLGLVRQLVQEPSVTPVIATARNIDKATDLKAIKSPKLHLVQLEMIDEQSIAQDVTKVSGIVGENGLDFLVNNAGIFNQAKLAGDLSKALVMEQFEVNTVAPLLLTNKFHGLLKKAAEKKGRSHVTNISSALGEEDFSPNADDNILWMEAPMPTALYAMSKAALNMLTRKLSREWKEDKIRATSFCPGWVKTDMGTDAAMLTSEYRNFIWKNQLFLSPSSFSLSPMSTMVFTICTMEKNCHGFEPAPQKWSLRQLGQKDMMKIAWKLYNGDSTENFGSGL